MHPFQPIRSKKRQVLTLTMTITFSAMLIILGGHALWTAASAAPGTERTPSDISREESSAPEDMFEFDLTLGRDDEIDPFEPTPEDVVERILAMAELTKEDVVYDLGSGDGRIPITAARQAGARGVGVELRPDLIEKSRKAARAAGVAKRVRFLNQDIFKADIRPATVVTLYLYPHTLLKLRPKLIRDLRPGTRIVAYDFGIEGWPRDKEEVIEVPGYLDEGVLYYWVVPANVSGVWQATMTAAVGKKVPFVLRFAQSFQQVTGYAVADGRKVPLSDITLMGNTLRFSISHLPGFPGKRPLSFVATADRHQLRGHADVRLGANDERHRQGQKTPLTWQAARNPKTQTPIDPDQRRGKKSGDADGGARVD